MVPPAADHFDGTAAPDSGRPSGFTGSLSRCGSATYLCGHGFGRAAGTQVAHDCGSKETNTMAIVLPELIVGLTPLLLLVIAVVVRP